MASDVENYSWHVVIIPANEEGLGFADSVGLFESFGHPEVILFDLRIGAVHEIINVFGEEVRSGRKFAEGEAALDHRGFPT